MKTVRPPSLRHLVTGLAVLLGAALVAPVATAQTRPALVRDVDEPARVPYAHLVAPTCNFPNFCSDTFPTVPAGKRLRLTNLQLLVWNRNGVNQPLYLAIFKNPAGSAFLAFPLNAFDMGFNGTGYSTNQHVDLIFEAGDTPHIEYGASQGTSNLNDSRTRVGVTGYLVDIAP